MTDTNARESRLTILMVDDEPPVVKIVTRMLALLG